MSQVKKVVVEGCGDVVQKFYERRLKRLKHNRGLDIVFTYQSAYDKDDQSLARKMNAIRSRLSWAKVIDVAETPRSHIPPADLVLVCTPDSTHFEVVSHWMQRPNEPMILVEKPLEANVTRATKLLRLSQDCGDRLGVIDHYRTRWFEAESDYRVFRRMFEIANNKHWLESLTYYFLEDHSWNDPEFFLGKSPAEVARQGPIEIENRVVALKQGLMLDLMPYPLDFLDRFADLQTVNVISAKVGQYTGVDGDLRRRTLISKETFAEVKIRFNTRFSDQSSTGTIYVGKGIGGVRRLRAYGDIRVAILKGTNGAAAEFDFEKSRVKLRPKTGRETVKDLKDFTSVFYQRLLKRVIEWERGPVVSFETAARVMEIIGQARSFVSSVKSKIPTYQLSPRGTNTRTLEDILRELHTSTAERRHWGARNQTTVSSHSTSELGPQK
jgi:predicted dehydrogenase